MEPKLASVIKKITGATDIEDADLIQTLWKGYGKILKVKLKGGPIPNVVVKHVAAPKHIGQRRKGKPDASHSRKVKSYQIEPRFYTEYAGKCDDECRVPTCLGTEKHGDEVVLVLEDLDAAGFPSRSPDAAWHEMTAGLCWLAAFHATFLHQKPEGLWNVGTYWHLDPRAEELKKLNDPELKAAAWAIDRRLRNTPRTFVHGDAKIQNFCFSPDGGKVAAVDFQYVGGGCGMKDVAYFVSSCLYESDCEEMETALLDIYFEALRSSVAKRHRGVNVSELEDAWRPLYRVAWADFHRFYKGWGNMRFSKNSYSERVSKAVCAMLRSKRQVDR